MKRLATFLFVLGATAGLAQAKDWKPGAVVGMSQTTLTGPMMHLPKIVMHYTVVTDEVTLFLDYTYHPPGNTNEPEEPGKEQSSECATHWYDKSCRRRSSRLRSRHQRQRSQNGDQEKDKELVRQRRPTQRRSDPRVVCHGYDKRCTVRTGWLRCWEIYFEN